MIDNSSLSSLTFIDSLDLLLLFFDNLVIPKAILNEFQEKWSKLLPKFIKVENIKITVDEILILYPALENFSIGDIFVFYLAINSNDLLITDDRRLRNFAESNGIDVIGTLRLMKSGYERGYFGTKAQYIKKIDKLISDIYVSEKLIEWAQDV